MNRTLQGEPNGFTLIELVLVLMLMGLIAGLTFPFVVSTLDRIKLKSEVRQITSAIKFTRSEAISRKTLFTFNVDIDKNQYWLAIPKQEEVTQSKSLDETVQIIDYKRADESFTDGTFIILFYPQGNSSGGTIRFKSINDKDEENIYEVDIDPITGKPETRILED